MLKKIQFIIKKFKPHTIKSIEKELVKNRESLNEIEYELREEGGGNKTAFWEHELAEIKNYNKILNLKRQHKLDGRNGWVSRFVWSILAPIIVAVIVSSLVNYFD